MVASGFVSVWHWFSQDHAIAAANHSRKCADLEARLAEASEDEGAPGHSSFEIARHDRRSFAIGSIMSAVAFLDACVSELFAAASYDNTDIGKQLNAEDRHALAGTTPLVANNRLLDRYQLALQLLRRAPFDRGAQPFQDADLTIRLRNELVHYTPQWRVAGEANPMAPDEPKLVRGLKSKLFSRNPFTGAANPFSRTGASGMDAPNGPSEAS
jgi:hypothetical protein